MAYLIQEGTPLCFVERDRGDSTTATQVETIDGQAAHLPVPGGEARDGLNAAGFSPKSR